MPTLIIEHGTKGKSRGQCDSRCYNAKSPNCLCCCGGQNHGVGLQTAIDNTRAMTEELLQKAEAAGTKIQVILPDLPKQPRDSKGRFVKVEKNREFVNQKIYDVI